MATALPVVSILRSARVAWEWRQGAVTSTVVYAHLECVLEHACRDIDSNGRDRGSAHWEEEGFPPSAPPHLWRTRQSRRGTVVRIHLLGDMLGYLGTVLALLGQDCPADLVDWRSRMVTAFEKPSRGDSMITRA